MTEVYYRDLYVGSAFSDVVSFNSRIRFICRDVPKTASIVAFSGVPDKSVFLLESALMMLYCGGFVATKDGGTRGTSFVVAVRGRVDLGSGKRLTSATISNSVALSFPTVELPDSAIDPFQLIICNIPYGQGTKSDTDKASVYSSSSDKENDACDDGTRTKSCDDTDDEIFAQPFSFLDVDDHAHAMRWIMEYATTRSRAGQAVVLVGNMNTHAPMFYAPPGVAQLSVSESTFTAKITSTYYGFPSQPVSLRHHSIQTVADHVIVGGATIKVDSVCVQQLFHPDLFDTISDVLMHADGQCETDLRKAWMAYTMIPAAEHYGLCFRIECA